MDKSTQVETDATAKQTRELLNAMTPYNAKANVKSILGLMDGQLDSIHGKWDNGVPSAMLRLSRLCMPTPITPSSVLPELSHLLSQFLVRVK